MKTEAIDFRRYYDLENLLFPVVAETFQKTGGDINVEDFWFILIWKANRAKSYAKKRLAKKGKTFPEAVRRIGVALHSATTEKDKLRILMQTWGFRLATASAIASVLYPTAFTVYDFRVCEILKRNYGAKDFGYLGQRKFSDQLWKDYIEFIEAVIGAAPGLSTLRDKDRYLWGHSSFLLARKKSVPKDRYLWGHSSFLQAREDLEVREGRKSKKPA